MWKGAHRQGLAGGGEQEVPPGEAGEAAESSVRAPRASAELCPQREARIPTLGTDLSFSTLGTDNSNVYFYTWKKNSEFSPKSNHNSLSQPGDD